MENVEDMGKQENNVIEGLNIDSKTEIDDREFSFEFSYSKIKDLQFEIQQLLYSLIRDYEESKQDEERTNKEIKQILSKSETLQTNLLKQNDILKKTKIIKELKQLLIQHRIKQSMLLRNISEITKSQVVQPKQMQDIVQLKKKSDLDVYGPQNQNIQEDGSISLSGLTFQDVIKIGEELSLNSKKNSGGR